MSLELRFAAAVLFMTVGASLHAQEGDWAFTVKSGAELELPQGPTIVSALAYLDYQPGEPVLGFLADLDLDGTDDYVIRPSTGLCGTGGCSYALIDGSRLERLGEVFGNPIVVRQQIINGYPVLNAYSHSSADSGTYGTFAFEARLTCSSVGYSCVVIPWSSCSRSSTRCHEVTDLYPSASGVTLKPKSNAI